MESAWIGILGAILGFAASYILEGLKRKWEREDLRREVRRKELEELSKNGVQVIKSYWDVLYSTENITPEINDKFEKIFLDFELTRTPSYDNKLNEAIEHFSTNAYRIYSPKNEVVGTNDGYEKLFHNLESCIYEIQDRVNELIDETYK